MIKAKLPKEYLNCQMCAKNKLQDVYIWGSFAMLPEHPYYELKICKDCAVKDHGHKNKIKLNDIIEERTKQWLKQKRKQ